MATELRIPIPHDWKDHAAVGGVCAALFALGLKNGFGFCGVGPEGPPGPYEWTALSVIGACLAYVLRHRAKAFVDAIPRRIVFVMLDDPSNPPIGTGVRMKAPQMGRIGRFDRREA